MGRSFLARTCAFLLIPCVGAFVVGCELDSPRDFGGGATGGSTSGTGGTIQGSGGEHGSGGRGMAGATGSGGAASGGRGGRAGTGGSFVSGGSNGSGGFRGTGGMAATGGSGGADPSTCDQLATDYRDEMPAAKSCNPLSGSILPLCQMSVPSSLGCGSSCPTYVQNATKLKQISDRWDQAGCSSIVQLCPALPCVAAQPGYCYATGMSTNARCQNGPP